MLTSPGKKFLFIHIQKTAGSSLRRALHYTLPDLRTVLGTHDTALQARRFLGEAEYSRYFVATFVRNPWDRLLSWYTMIIQTQARMPLWRKLCRKEGPRLWQYVRENSNSFEEFIHRCTADVADRDGRKSFCRNQVEYLTDEEGRLIVDFVGRYESLHQDTERLFTRLGLAGVKLPHVNPSNHRHYSTYYSDDLAEVVRHRYARDIETFGYEFSRGEPAPLTMQNPHSTTDRH
jgi:hypothetical protein